MRIYNRYYLWKECTVCGKKFPVIKSKIRPRGSQRVALRPRTSKTCSKEHSRIFLRDRRKYVNN